MIGDAEPQGLCGSGLVDAVAELVRVGLLDSSGRLIPEERAAELVQGLADRERGLPNTHATTFGTTSVGKMFTVVAVMQLVWRPGRARR